MYLTQIEQLRRISISLLQICIHEQSRKEQAGIEAVNYYLTAHSCLMIVLQSIIK